MRVSTTLLAAGAAVILLSACSSAPQSSSVGLLPTGAVPSLKQPAGYAKVKAGTLQLPDGRVLYISEFSEPGDVSGGVDVQKLRYLAWLNLGQITNGINGPFGDWVDKGGNLYVANANGANVTEYNPSGSLIFTYSSGLASPQNVATDLRGNVYVTDFQHQQVSEYAQGSNAPVSCSQSPNYPGGVAVDKDGDVFVSSLASGSGNGFIVEYPRGLRVSNCQYVVLTTAVFGPVGIALDPQGNLLVCDAYSAVVDVLAPPYTSITRTFGPGGWSEPVSISFDRSGTTAYVTDAGSEAVYILNYPSGTVVTVLGTANGLEEPVDAVDSKNFVL